MDTLLASRRRDTNNKAGSVKTISAVHILTHTLVTVLTAYGPQELLSSPSPQELLPQELLHSSSRLQARMTSHHAMRKSKLLASRDTNNKAGSTKAKQFGNYGNQNTVYTSFFLLVCKRA